MARGTMYELQREKDFLNQLQEEELYEHLPDIAESVKTEKNKEGAVCILLEEMQELGAVVGKEDDIPYIIFTKDMKWLLKISYSWGDEEPYQEFNSFKEAWDTAKKDACNEAEIASIEANDETCEIGITFEKEEDRGRITQIRLYLKIRT